MQHMVDVRCHPLKGARILRSMKNEKMDEVIKCVRHHHERYDGTGYPDKLKAENIPLTARIIAIADSFDAMTTDRPYRKAMTTDLAVAEIDRGAGFQFDSNLVKSFKELMGDKLNPKECANINTCSLFPRIGEPEISKAFEMQYCRANYQGCERYIGFWEGKLVSDYLLPDGELLLGAA